MSKKITLNLMENFKKLSILVMVVLQDHYTGLHFIQNNLQLFWKTTIPLQNTLFFKSSPFFQKLGKENANNFYVHF